MDVADDLRPGHGEEVVVADELMAVIGIERAAKIGLAELMALDHGAHGPVQHQHAPGCGRFERGQPGIALAGSPATRSVSVGRPAVPLPRSVPVARRTKNAHRG